MTFDYCGHFGGRVAGECAAQPLRLICFELPVFSEEEAAKTKSASSDVELAQAPAKSVQSELQLPATSNAAAPASIVLAALNNFICFAGH